MKEVSSQNVFMISYDVCSLFTSIPLEETINIAVDLIFSNNPNIRIKKKILTGLLSPVFPTENCAQDSFSFCKEMKEVSSQNVFMISYDVCSLFTSIPLEETINIAADLIFSNNPNIRIKKSELKKLFHFATSGTHFLFDGSYYDQIDGVAMGSPLGPVLANLFMGYYESKWLSEFKEAKVILYRGYVDDIFCLFYSEADADSFFEFLNKQHKNIKFTFEKENKSKLAFLDALIINNNDKFSTSVFRKDSNIGLFTNFCSFTPMTYKKGLIKTLLSRAFKLSSSWQLFHNEIENIKVLLQKNSYPPNMIDEQIKNFLDSKLKANHTNNISNDNVHYF